MPLLHLIRHGEPQLTGVMLGQLDPPLSETGKVALASCMGRIAVNIVWSSPLLRARETAALLHSGQVRVVGDLREIDYGMWTGKTWAQVESSWPELAARKLDNWLGVTPPGGEEWNNFEARVSRAWQMIREHAEIATAVVAHQGVNAALLHLVLGRDPVQCSQAYGEVISIEYD